MSNRLKYTFFLPREGEQSRKSKDLLKMLCKTRIVKPTFRERPSRPVAKLFHSCDVVGCGKTYTSPSSLSRHKRELHAPPQHECACGIVFKRLKAKKDRFGCYMVGKIISEHNLEDDLRRSDMDDSDMEELARSIEQYNTISNKKQ
jgi:hypothetical protein